MEDFDYILIITIFYLVNCLVLFSFYITMCFIHIREPLFKTNFFKVIFIQIILETLNIFFLFILALTILISKENKEWHLFFHTLINFFTFTDLIYNIIILIYLTFKRGKKTTEEDDSDRTNFRDSIAFEKHSFKIIHIISFSLGVVHSIIFFFIRDKNDYIIQSWGNWYYFFYPIKANYYNILIFLPFLILLIMSICYKFFSSEALKVTNYIHLNHYCINCLICGIFGIIVPIIKIISINIEKSEFPVLLFSSLFFLLYLNCICFFRFNCFYIDDIFNSTEKGFVNKIKLFFNLMLLRIEVPKPNIIDFNNPFIYHSLAYESDFSNVNQKQKSISLSNKD